MKKSGDDVAFAPDEVAGWADTMNLMAVGLLNGTVSPDTVAKWLLRKAEQLRSARK